MPPCSALSIGSVGAKCTFAQRKDGSQEGVDWRGHEVVVPGGAVLFGDGIVMAILGRTAQQQGTGEALELTSALWCKGGGGGCDVGVVAGEAFDEGGCYFGGGEKVVAEEGDGWVAAVAKALG